MTKRQEKTETAREPELIGKTMMRSLEYIDDDLIEEAAGELTEDITGETGRRDVEELTGETFGTDGLPGEAPVTGTDGFTREVSPGRRRRIRFPAVAAAAILILLAGSGAWQYLAPHTHQTASLQKSEQREAAEEEAEEAAAGGALEIPETDGGMEEAAAEADIPETDGAVEEAAEADLGVADGVLEAEADIPVSDGALEEAAEVPGEKTGAPAGGLVFADSYEQIYDQLIPVDGTPLANFSITEEAAAERVDEADIVKDDKGFSYHVLGQSIRIRDTRKGQETILTLPEQDPSLTICETCEEDGHLIVIGERTKEEKISTPEEVASQSEASTEEEEWIDLDLPEAPRCEIAVYVYDLKDPLKPQMTGSLVQDGSYQTFRKNGDVLYVFSEAEILRPDRSREEAAEKDYVASWIPCVNQTPVAAGDVCLAEPGNRGLLMSAFHLEESDPEVKSQLILLGAGTYKVGNQEVYVYPASENETETPRVVPIPFPSLPENGTEP